jgi:hypothetical protein
MRVAFAVLLLAAGQEPQARGFEMGVSLIPYDISVEAMLSLGVFVRDHAELVTQKATGALPWEEALRQRPYPPLVELGLAGIKGRVENRKVFLSTTPLNAARDGLADSAGAAPESGPAWKDREFDHPDVIKAYVNFCRDLIARIKPEYFACAIEANALARNAPRWKRFLVLAKEVYTTLKKEHPELPVFVTIGLGTYHESEAVQKRAVTQLLAFSDWVVVVAYPFIAQPNPAKIPRDYFAKVAALGGRKPFAVAETCFIAEDFLTPESSLYGKEAWQDDYLRFVLEESAKLNGKFLIWLVTRDYDRIWDKLPPGTPELFKLMRDGGLVAGDGRERKAFQTWKTWHQLPRK